MTYSGAVVHESREIVTTPKKSQCRFTEEQWTTIKDVQKLTGMSSATDVLFMAISMAWQIRDYEIYHWVPRYGTTFREKLNKWEEHDASNTVNYVLMKSDRFELLITLLRQNVPGLEYASRARVVRSAVMFYCKLVKMRGNLFACNADEVDDKYGLLLIIPGKMD